MNTLAHRVIHGVPPRRRVAPPRVVRQLGTSVAATCVLLLVLSAVADRVG